MSSTERRLAAVLPSKRGRNREVGEVDAVVGQRIRLRRIIQQMSLPELAERIGVTQQQLQKYETGQNRISSQRLHSLATALGVPVGWFFQDVPAPVQETLDSMSDPQDLATGLAALTANYKKIQDPEARKSLVVLSELLSRTANSR